MNVHEIFEDLAGRMVTATMLHSQLCSYFTFLSLEGLAARHKYQYFEESNGYLKLEEYYTKHYNKILLDAIPENPRIIPLDMKSISFYNISDKHELIRRYIMDGMNKWIDWEDQSLVFYSDMYKELININDISAADFLLKYVKDTNKELMDAQFLDKQLRSTNYDLPTLYDSQDKDFKKYSKKLKELFS